MAVMALGVAGAAVGGVLTGGAGIGAGFAIGSMLGNMLTANHSAANPLELKISGSAWGVPIPRVYGTSRVPGNMVWAGPLHQDTGGSKLSQAKGKGGGGGGKSGKQPGNIGDLTISFALAFCEGPITGFTKYWADGNLVIDNTAPSSLINPPVMARNEYFGTESQGPDSNITSWVSQNVPSAPNAPPAFRGIAYVVFENLDLTPFGNRIPVITAEVTSQPQDNFPAQEVVTLPEGSPSAGSTAALTGVNVIDYQTLTLYTLLSNGISITNLNTMTQARSVVLDGPMTEGEIVTEGELVVGTNPYSLPTAINLVGLGTSQNGYVYAVSASGGTFPFGFTPGVLYQLNPNSLQITSRCMLFMDTGTSPQVLVNTVPTLTGTVDVVVIIGQFNEILIVSGEAPIAGNVDISSGDASETNALSPLEYDEGWFSNYGVFGCVGAVTASGEAEFWMINQPGLFQSGPLYIYEIVASPGPFGPTAVMNPVGTVSPSDLGITTKSTVYVMGMAYDITDDSIIVSVESDDNGMTVTFKWNLTAGIKWVTHGVGWGPNPNYSATYSGLVTGTLGVFGHSADGTNTYNGFALINTVTGAVIENPSSITSAGTWDISTTNQVYNSLSQAIIQPNSSDSQLTAVYFGLSDTGDYPIADIISDTCLRCGLVDSQFDVTAITDTVTGYVATRQITGKDIMSQLMQTFFFDVVESDFKLKFVPRGQAAVATITQDDLGDASTNDQGNYWIHKRAQQQDIPIQVNVTFQDVDNDYLDNAAYAKRVSAPVTVVPGKQKLTVKLPFSLDITTATNIATTWLYTLWQERDSYNTTLGWQYAYLDPADNVTVTLDSGESDTVRMTTLEMGGDYTLKTAFIGEDMDTYVPAFAAGAMTTSTTYKSAPFGPQVARLLLMDVPLLQDSDDTGGLYSCTYYAVAPYATGYVGGVVFNALDNENFTQMAIVTTPCTWGTCLSILPAPASLFATDTESELTVLPQLAGVPFTTLSDINFLAGANAALVGSEIIYFQNVVVNADNSVTLSTLLRGVRGTEWACGQHTVGELFIFLNLSQIESRDMALDTIGQTQYYKLVSASGSLDTAADLPHAYLGYDLLPYAPVDFARSPSGEDLVLTWVRRTRIGGALQEEIGTVPLGEESESYDLYILNVPYDPVGSNWQTPSGGEIVRSSLALTSPTYTYTSAHMSADSFTPSTDTLYVVVFQNSAAIGHGWPGSASLAPF
jgi:hypothetical protein